jgi:hypothetical protein
VLQDVLDDLLLGGGGVVEIPAEALVRYAFVDGEDELAGLVYANLHTLANLAFVFVDLMRWTVTLTHSPRESL